MNWTKAINIICNAEPDEWVPIVVYVVIIAVMIFAVVMVGGVE